MSEPIHDLLVIGGGINGAGIARDAAGRGLSVVLTEKDDLASHTSSSSTKLVHGGLRYLEHYEFRLVREALAEREVLLRTAPHIIWPLRFVLPHDAGLRPKWMLRIGLFLYDHIGGRRSLPGSHSVDLTTPPHNAVLQTRFTNGFEYSDCWVEDSRMVALNAVDARAKGAEIQTRTKCIGLKRQEGHWLAALQQADGTRSNIRAKAIANAAGPWVDDLAIEATRGSAKAHLRLVKGSHIIVARKFEGEHAYIFQNGDGRIIFAIPYERDFTLIGTTDQLFEGDRNEVEISTEERTYLCDAVSEYFREPVRDDDVVWAYAGIRPLYEDNSSDNSTVTRDYVFEVDAPNGAPPLLSIYGGKITTYRKLAEHALAKLAPHLPADVEMGKAWTSDALLPGGDIAGSDFAAFLAAFAADHPWMPAATALRLTRAYGTNIAALIGDANSLDALGAHIAGDLYEAEIRYLVEHEFARTAEDILWRRSKLGLHLRPDSEAKLDAWIASNIHFA